MSADTLFDFLPEYRLIVCKECRHAVMPGEVPRHLLKKHKLRGPNVREQIKDQIFDKWPTVGTTIADFTMPTGPIPQIPQLELENDKYRCTVCEDPATAFLSSNSGEIRKHWNSQHGAIFSAGSHGGVREKGVSTKAERYARGCVKIFRQRFFASKDQTNYVEVIPLQNSNGTLVQVAEQAEDEEHEQAVSRYLVRYQAAHQHSALVSGLRDPEPSPWLTFAQWSHVVTYRDDPLQLRQLLDRPPSWKELDMSKAARNSSRPDLALVYEQDATELRMIWDAVAICARAGESCLKNGGVYLGAEAKRDADMSSNIYQPLRPFYRKTSFQTAVQLWQKALMFFFRSQQNGGREWAHIYYLNADQRNAWRDLMQAVRQGPEDGDRDTETPDDETLDYSAVLDEEEYCDDDLVDSDDDISEYPTEIEVGNRMRPPPAFRHRLKIRKLTQVQLATLRFCMTLLSAQTGHELENPFNRFLAVLAIRADGLFERPERFSSTLSGLIKIARFQVILDSCYEHQTDSMAYIDQLKEFYKANMLRASRTTMSWMLTLRTYFMSIGSNTTADGRVIWTDDGELLYGALRFSMGSFRGFVHSLVKSTLDILLERLLFCTAGELPEIPWDDLRDDLRIDTPEYSFMDDSHLKLADESSLRWLLDRTRLGRLKPEFYDSTGIKQRRGTDYLKDAQKFREMLLVLIHITAGMPARAPEILTTRWMNTTKGPRNVSIEDKLVVLISRYHKGYAITGDTNVIHRYLPVDVGALLVWYLWLVEPFIVHIKGDLGLQPPVTPFLFPAWPDSNVQSDDKVIQTWVSPRLRLALKQQSSRYLGQELNISSYRHIAVAISHKHLQGERDGFDDLKADDKEEDDAMDTQAGHSSRTAALIYGRNATEAKGVSAIKRERFRKVSLAWHDFLGFARPKDTGDKASASTANARSARLQRLQTTDLARAMNDKFGAEFRGKQEDALREIVAGTTCVIAVLPTGFGKSVLFMLPALLEPSGTTIVVVPLLSLSQDLKRRCTDAGIRCMEWNGKDDPDRATIVLVTPEAVHADTFATWANRLKLMNQLDRIVIDECHTLLSESSKFRPLLSLQGDLMRFAVQMVCLTGTLPPTDEARLAEKLRVKNGMLALVRMSVARPNIRYSALALSKEFCQSYDLDPIGFAVEKIKGRRDKYKDGKIIVYCKTVGLVNAMAQKLDTVAYHARVYGKDDVLSSFVNDPSTNLIVATSALGLGLDVPNVRCVFHIGRPYTLLDFAQESGRAGRDLQPSESIIYDLGDDYPSTPTPSAKVVADRDLVEGYLSRDKCRRAYLGNYLDHPNDRVECGIDGVRPCDNCERRQRAIAARSTSTNGSRRVHSGITDAQPQSSSKRPIAQVIDLAEDGKGGSPRQKTGTIPATSQAIARYASNAIQDNEREKWTFLEEIEKWLYFWRNKCPICYIRNAREHLPSDNHACKNKNMVSRSHQLTLSVARQIKYQEGAGCYSCGLPLHSCSRSIVAGQNGSTAGVCDRNLSAFHVLFGLLYAASTGVARAWSARVEKEYGSVGIKWISGFNKPDHDVRFEERWITAELGIKADKYECTRLVYEVVNLSRMMVKFQEGQEFVED